MDGAISLGAPLVLLTFLVALVYSSVGHGGASGYLALLSFYSIPHEAGAASALCLNLLVSGTAFYTFAKSRHFSWRFTWPLVAFSIPAAFLGGLLNIPKSFYALLLSGILIFAGWRLWVHANPKREVPLKPAPRILLLEVGAGTGLLSGVVGAGGGIFLSPLLLFFRWAAPKQTAASSAFFILVNSASGLLGRLYRHRFVFPALLSEGLLFALAAAFTGGL